MAFSFNLLSCPTLRMYYTLLIQYTLFLHLYTNIHYYLTPYMHTQYTFFLSFNIINFKDHPTENSNSGPSVPKLNPLPLGQHMHTEYTLLIYCLCLRKRFTSMKSYIHTYIYTCVVVKSIV